MGVSGRRGGTRARPSRFLRLGFAVATTENPHPVFRGSRLGGFQGVNMGVSPAADTPAGWQECLGESELLGGALFQTCGLADYSLPSSGRYFTDPPTSRGPPDPFPGQPSSRDPGRPPVSGGGERVGEGRTRWPAGRQRLRAGSCHPGGRPQQPGLACHAE